MKRFLSLVALLTASVAQAADRPNIILMLADDQGWSGTSVAMHPEVKASKSDLFQTPNLEKLASQGMRFSAAYAPAPVCSPTRISLQTGKSPAALHWTKAAPPEEGHKLLEPRLIKSISRDEVTIGELLQKAGYLTAHYGKWHIGGGGPESHGYDESDGDTGNEQAFKFDDPNPVDIFGMAERTEKFMAKAQQAGKPFYIQLSWNALHAYGNALKATKAKYAKLVGDKESKEFSVAPITEDLDTGVGRVLASLDKLGLVDNTYVIYTSDNGSGGGKRNGGLNGGKGDVREGGIRVPMIVRGPGVRPNSWCHTRVVGYDFLPTFAEWAGIDAKKLPQAIEGGSIAKLLANHGQGTVTRARDELVFHFPHYQGDTPHSALVLGDLKLLKFYEDNHIELYDLAKDISERNDLATKMPREAKQLRERLEAYLAAVDAQLPTKNPNYDPSRPAPPIKKGGKQGEKKKGMKK